LICPVPEEEAAEAAVALAEEEAAEAVDSEAAEVALEEARAVAALDFSRFSAGD
jgi:hypothetical protein